MPYRVRECDPSDASPLAALFERCQVHCYCRYWHFTGDRNAWLDRVANAPGDNRDEMTAALARRSPEMTGVVAVADDGTIAGWLKLSPATTVPKLYDQRLYKNLPCFAGDRSGVFTVGCVLVDDSVRRQGVARALVRGAVELARAKGARSVEAFPHRPGGDVADALLWTGPASAFLAEGFEEVHAFAPYPVLRLELT